MTFETADLSPPVGTGIKADADALLSGEHAAEIRELHFDRDQQRVFSHMLGKVQPQGEGDPHPLEEGRMMHRTTIEAEEALV